MKQQVQIEAGLLTRWLGTMNSPAAGHTLRLQRASHSRDSSIFSESMKPPEGTTDIVVSFSTPFPVYLPDTMAESNSNQVRPEFQVAGNPPTAINLIRRMNPTSKIGTALELDGGDPFGRFSTSDVQVRFSLKTSPEVAELEYSQLATLATASLNRLIEHYRDLAEKPLVRRLSPADLSHFTIHYLRVDQQPDSRQYATGHGPLVGRPPEEVQVLDAKIRARLVLPKGPPLFRELELRAQQLFGEGDYRGSVIESAILFECWLKAFVRHQFALNGLPTERIEAKLRTKRGEAHSADYFARNLVKEATGLDFESTNEFSAWRQKLADVRNDLVHGTRHSVSQNEAAEGWDAFRNAKNFILKAVAATKTASGKKMQCLDTFFAVRENLNG